jgi:hypothetical protein
MTTGIAAALVGAALVGALADASSGHPAQRPAPPARLTARRLRARPDAVASGSRVPSSRLFTDRVFAGPSVGFALADDNQAQYPVRSIDGGSRWRIDGPQVHIDAADGPEGVGYVGVRGPRTYYAYGSQAIDVSPNGGRTWWETFVPGLAAAVVSNAEGHLVAYVQPGSGVTWQYVSSDGGRHWRYSTAVGGG